MIDRSPRGRPGWDRGVTAVPERNTAATPGGAAAGAGCWDQLTLKRTTLLKTKPFLSTKVVRPSAPTVAT